MRRSDREIKDSCGLEEIVKKCEVCRIGFIDGEYPYIVPLNFGYFKSEDKWTLYFHGATEGKKLELIAKNPHVAFEMDCSNELVSAGDSACNYSYKYASIMGQGIISVLTIPEEKEKAFLIIMEHMTGRSDFVIPKEAIAKTAVMKIEVKTISGKSHS